MSDEETDFFLTEDHFFKYQYRYGGKTFFEIQNSSNGDFSQYHGPWRAGEGGFDFDKRTAEPYYTSRWDLADRQAKMTPYSEITEWSTDGTPLREWSRDPKHPEHTGTGGRGT